MQERRRPERSRKARAVEEGTDFDRKGAVEYFHTAILRWAICTCWLNGVAKLVQHHPFEFGAPSKFTALVRPDTAVAIAKLLHERAKYLERGFLRLGEEAPDTSRSAVNDGKVRAETVV